MAKGDEFKFEVRNAGLEAKLKELGNLLAGNLPPGIGFTLILFQFTGNATFYISNAQRKTMIEALEEMLVKLRGHS